VSGSSGLVRDYSAARFLGGREERGEMVAAVAVGRDAHWGHWRPSSDHVSSGM
jgi:hypothetical protein